MRLKSIYGSRFSSWIDGHDTRQIALIKNEWVQSLEGIETHKIKLAIEKCRLTEEFMPSIARFVFLAHDLADSELAYKLATNKDFSYPLIQKARQMIGSWTFSHSSEDELRKIFRRTYGEVTAKFILEQAQNNKKLMLDEPSEISNNNKISNNQEINKKDGLVNT